MENVKIFKLKNGMEVLFEKIKGVSVVSIFFVIKKGSGSEIKGKEGVSHFLEHMIFKGTKELSSNEIISQIENLGGSANGYTSLDETAYYITIPKKNWKYGFDILEKMIFGVNFDIEEFENERKVIIEELQGGKENPYRILIDETFQTVFSKHPYKNPVIGFKETIENFTIEDIITFYNQNYSPKNILVAIAGDIKEKELKEKIFTLEKYKNSSISLKNCNIIKEPVQTEHRIKIVKSKVNQYYLNIAFRLPGKYFRDFATIQILCSLLGEFENSILKSKLKDELSFVTDINTFIHFCRDYSIFIINAVFPEKYSPINIIKTIFSEIELVKNTPFSDDQILKAIINHKSDKIFSKENVSGAIRNLIFYHLVTGNFNFENKFLDELNKITAYSLQKCCSKYLDFSKANIILLSPENKDIKIDKNELIKKKINKYTRVKKRKRFLITLDNGIRIIFQKDKRLPIISFNMSCLGGVMFEKKNSNGLTNLMAKTLIKGSRHYSRKEIDEKFDFYSGIIDSFAGRNSFGMQSLILKDYFNSAFKIFSDILTNPLFPMLEIDKTKKNIIETIIAENDDIYTTSIRFFYETIFRNSYYSMPVKGTIENLEKFSRDDILEMFNNCLKTDNMVFGVYGDIDGKDIDRIVASLADLRKSNLTLNSKLPILKNEYIFKTKSIAKKQSHIVCGAITPGLSSDDTVGMQIIKTIIGNHSGKLFFKLREELGLCYHTFAFYLNALEAGAFGIYLSTSPEKEKFAIEKLIEILRDLRKNGVSSEEVLKAKNFIKGSIAVYNQKYLNVNQKNVYNILYKLGEDYDKVYLNKLNRYNKLKINEIVEKYLNPDKFTFTIVHPGG